MTIPRRLALSLFTLLLALPALSTAEEPAPPKDDGKKAVREAYQAWQEIETAGKKARDEASTKTAGAKTDEEKTAAREAFWKVMREYGKKSELACESFRNAFIGSDWAAWNTREDAALLEAGLMEAGRGLIESEPKRSVQAFEAVLERLPQSNSATQVRSTWLPIALPAAGDFAHAVKRCTELLDAAGEDRKPDVLMQIGDIWAIQGDFEKAQKCYADARALIPDKLKQYDYRGYTRGYLDLRIATIGKQAPEIDSKTWLGEEARPLSKLRGKVVVLDFWATWCGHCIEAIPFMNEFYAGHDKEKMTILGVTTYYKNGFLPKDIGELKYNYKDGESMQLVDKDGKLDEKANLDLIAKFRERIGVDYPFVVAAREDFKAYHISGIPTVYVVGKDGRINFVAIGGCRGALIAATVTRLVKEKYEPK